MSKNLIKKKSGISVTQANSHFPKKKPSFILHGKGEYGVSYRNEEGGFMYLQLNVGGSKVTLKKVTFDFSNLGFEITGDGFAYIPSDHPGVDSYELFTNSVNQPAVFGFTAVGLGQGDELLLLAPKIGSANKPVPLAQDLFNGKLILEFSDGLKKTAFFSSIGRNGTAGIAAF